MGKLRQEFRLTKVKDPKVPLIPLFDLDLLHQRSELRAIDSKCLFVVRYSVEGLEIPTHNLERSMAGTSRASLLTFKEIPVNDPGIRFVLLSIKSSR